jgi:hypothetical protein
MTLNIGIAVDKKPAIQTNMITRRILLSSTAGSFCATKETAPPAELPSNDNFLFNSSDLALLSTSIPEYAKSFVELFSNSLELLKGTRRTLSQYMGTKWELCTMQITTFTSVEIFVLAGTVEQILFASCVEGAAPTATRKIPKYEHWGAIMTEPEFKGITDATSQIRTDFLDINGSPAVEKSNLFKSIHDGIGGVLICSATDKLTTKMQYSRSGDKSTIAPALKLHSKTMGVVYNIRRMAQYQQ